MQGLWSKRAATRRYAVLAAVWMMAGTAAAVGQEASCSAGDTSLGCRLTGVLHWLEAAAFVLVLVLVAVIGVAIHLFRKNRLSRKEGR